MKYFITLFLLCMVSAYRCYAPALTITQPGYYELGDDITFSPGVADSIISIQSSDVTLDLGGKIIQQSNATAGVDGIALASGLSNITIRNGIIRNVTNRGIFVDTTAMASEIVITDLILDTCQNRGISFEGAGGAESCIIAQCRFINCILSATGDFVLNFGNLSNAQITDIFIATDGSISASGATRVFIRSSATIARCLFKNITVSLFSTALGVSIVGFTATALQNSVFQNIRLTNITSAAAATYTGFSLPTGTANCIFNNCVSQGITALGSPPGGIISHISATGTTTGNLFIGCTAQTIAAVSISLIPFNLNTANNTALLGCLVQNCSTTNGTFSAFSLTSATGALLIDCTCNQNSAISTIDGFLLTTCTRCNLARCISTNNTSSGAGVRAAGYRFQQSTQCSCTDSIAAGNSAPTLGSGFYITSNSTDCCFRGNSSYRNGVGSATSTGFETDIGGTGTNGFTENAALRNGNAAANQFLNFTANMRTLLAVTNTNPATSSWTNVAFT